MKKIGLRELKNHLSRYVRRVRAGDAIQVTDRGEVVAELVPPRRADARRNPRERLADLARQGLATLGAPNDSRLYRRFRPLGPPGTAQRLLDEERGDR